MNEGAGKRLRTRPRCFFFPSLKGLFSHLVRAGLFTPLNAPFILAFSELSNGS